MTQKEVRELQRKLENKKTLGGMRYGMKEVVDALKQNVSESAAKEFETLVNDFCDRRIKEIDDWIERL